MPSLFNYSKKENKTNFVKQDELIPAIPVFWHESALKGKRFCYAEVLGLASLWFIDCWIGLCTFLTPFPWADHVYSARGYLNPMVARILSFDLTPSFYFMSVVAQPQDFLRGCLLFEDRNCAFCISDFPIIPTAHAI